MKHIPTVTLLANVTVKLELSLIRSKFYGLSSRSYRSGKIVLSYWWPFLVHIDIYFFFTEI